MPSNPNKQTNKQPAGKATNKATTEAAVNTANETANKDAAVNTADEVIINGVAYVPKGPDMAVNTAGKPYCIIRTYSAGVHAGYLMEQDGKVVTLLDARRIWYWAGAFTLSEIAVNGVSKPDECKFSTTVPQIILTEAIEIIPCTEDGRKSIQSVDDYQCN